MEMITKTYVVATNSEEDTIELGRLLSQVFENRVIAVSGDLGAGKTYLAKGIGLGMGIKRHITSPTFNILNIYRNKEKTFYHMDAYRLTNPDMAYDVGVEDVLLPKGITLIEWAENIHYILPPGCVNIYMEKTSEEYKRLLFITADRETIDRMALHIYEDSIR